MEPKFKDGDHVLTVKIPFFIRNLKINDVIVFQKYGKFFIKKISKITNGRYFVVGENIKDSLDSRKFGTINSQDILGKVIIKI